jgi:tetratricopeptide (TPR) repeat protein
VKTELEALVVQLRRRACVLCLGGELTRDGSLRRLIGELLGPPSDDNQDARALLTDRPLVAADFTRRRLGAELAPRLRGLTESSEVVEPLRLLGGLPFSQVLTTALAPTVERAFSREGAPARVHLPSKGPRPPAQIHARAVWKLLGDPAQEDSLVWGAADLQRALARDGYRPIAHELFRTHSFLFVGFDAGDAELQLVLERVLSDAPTGSRSHFALLPDATAVERDHLRETYRIDTLPCADALELARALTEAMRDHALPAEDDPEGWLAILREDPSRHDAQGQLDRIAERLRSDREHEALAGLLVGRAEIEEDASRRAALLTSAAHLLDVELRRPGDALATVEAALAIDGAHADGLQVRVGLLRQLELWQPLVEALGRSVSAAKTSAQRSAIHTELGRLYEEQLADPLAAAACYQVAIDEDSLAAAPQRLLEELLARRGEHQALVGLLEHRLTTAFGAERRALLTRIADIYADQLSDPAQAVLRYHDLLLDTPADTKLLWRMALLWQRQPAGGPRAAEYLERLLAVAPRDETIFTSLELIYTEGREWHQLLDTYRRHAAIAPPATRVALWLEAGALCERDLQDRAAALQAYLEVDRAEPNHPAALAALTRLYEATADRDRAIAVIERRAAGAGEARQRAELHHHAGELASAQAADPRAGKPHFAAAVAADATFLPPMLALVELHRQAGESLEAARLLAGAATHASAVPQRTRFLIEAGELYEAGGEVDRAAASYLGALELDPSHVEAASRACAVLRRAGRHQDLLPIIETLARREAPRAVRIDRLETLAATAIALGDLAKAQKTYEAILVMAPSHVGALRGRADVLFRHEDWSTALLALDQLAEHSTVLSTAEQVELHHRRGVCARRLDRATEAREQFERARELDPTHRPSLLALLDLGEPNVAALIATKRGLTKTASADERRRLWTDIGDLYIDKLENPIDAAAAWMAGLEARPTDVALLHRLMRLHVEQKAWADALGILERLVDHEKAPVARAKYRYTAGMICLEHTGRFSEAADHLWASVQDDPTLERAQVALETMLKNHKSWKELARLYRWSLKQLDARSQGDHRDDKKKLQLWITLGELCLTRLHDTEAALLAFEVAARLEPTDLSRQEQLAQVYALAGPKYLAKQIAARQALLFADKAQAARYEALRAVYMGHSQPKKAAACELAIAALRDEPLPLRDMTAPALERPLSEDAWAKLRHPDEDPLISGVFVLVSPIVIASMAQRARSALQRQRLVPPGDSRRFAKVLRHAARTLGLPLPALDVKAEQEMPASFALHLDENLVVPVLTIGAPMLEAAASDEELWFLAGRCVALLRPERLLRWLMPLPQQLAHLVEAAIALGKGGKADGELAKTVAGLRRELTPVALDQLAGLGAALDTGDRNLVERARNWMIASDHSATRAGYVLCGDLATCRDSLLAAQRPDHVAPQPQRVLELVWSSVTEDVFDVQARLAEQRA